MEAEEGSGPHALRVEQTRAPRNGATRFKKKTLDTFNETARPEVVEEQRFCSSI